MCLHRIDQTHRYNSITYIFCIWTLDIYGVISVKAFLDVCVRLFLFPCLIKPQQLELPYRDTLIPAANRFLS